MWIVFFSVIYLYSIWIVYSQYSNSIHIQNGLYIPSLPSVFIMDYVFSHT